MFEYLVFYAWAGGLFIFEIYKMFIRKAPITESEVVMKNYTLLKRKYKCLKK